MRLTTPALLAALALGAWCSHAARADVMFTFDHANAQYTAAPGSPAQVSIFLTLNHAGADELTAATSFGVAALGADVTQAAGAPQIVAVTANPDFPASAVSDDLTGFLGIGSPTTGATLGEIATAVSLNGGDHILIGTFAIQAAALPGTTSFTVSAPPDVNGTFDANSNPIAFNPLNASFTVQTVPEPASLALLGLGACAWLLRRRA